MSADLVPARRTCGAPTKSGEPCRSTILVEGGRCAIHAGQVDPAALGRSGGLAAGENRREAAKTVRERLREKVEAELETVWGTFHDGLTATTSYVTKDGDVVTTPDHRARVAAASALLAEAYGRPPVSIETTGQPTTIVFQTAALAQVIERERKAEEGEP